MAVRTSLLSFNYNNRPVREVTGFINPTFGINLNDRRNLSSFYQYSFTAGIFFLHKVRYLSIKETTKKVQGHFRKWHVSKLNLIFLLSRSVTKAPVSRLIKNSTQETYLHFISIHLRLGFFSCIKSGTCQSRKQPKKLKVNFRKWHVSKLNLIFLPSRSVTKATVSRLINNSTPPHKPNSRPSSN